MATMIDYEAMNMELSIDEQRAAHWKATTEELKKRVNLFFEADDTTPNQPRQPMDNQNLELVTWDQLSEAISETHRMLTDTPTKGATLGVAELLAAHLKTLIEIQSIRAGIIRTIGDEPKATDAATDDFIEAIAAIDACMASCQQLLAERGWKPSMSSPSRYLIGSLRQMKVIAEGLHPVKLALVELREMERQ